MMIGVAFATKTASDSGFDSEIGGSLIGGAGNVGNGGGGGGGGRRVGASSMTLLGLSAFCFVAASTMAEVIRRIFMDRGGVGLTIGPSVGADGVVGGSSGGNAESADGLSARELRWCMSVAQLGCRQHASFYELETRAGP